MSNESPADTALQVAGALEAVGHAVRHAIASVDWPGGITPCQGEFALMGYEPEVVDLLAGEHAPDPAHWSRHYSGKGAMRAATVEIAGLRVVLFSRRVPGQFSSEFVRSES